MPFGHLSGRRWGSEWHVAVAFDTTGTTPHISCVINHEVKELDDIITNEELIAICKTQMARMKQVRLLGNRVLPVSRVDTLAVALLTRS